MEQRQQNLNWEDKPQVKKGDIGEDAVERYLEGQGYIVYKPMTDAAHPFDRFCVKDKTDIFIAEVKTKPKRKYYPDTGFNYKHYKEYLYMQDEKKIPVFIFFVDEESGSIYGNWLDNMAKEKTIQHNNKLINYPKVENGIIYFPIESMRDIEELRESEIESIKGLYTGAY